MKNKEIFKILKTLNCPVAYHSFSSKPKLPCVVYYQSGSDNFGADNKVYCKDNNYNIEVYDNYKNFELEEKIENLLDEHDIYWSKSDDIRIEKEKLTEVIYYI